MGLVFSYLETKRTAIILFDPFERMYSFVLDEFDLFCSVLIGCIVLAGVLYKSVDIFRNRRLTVFTICTNEGYSHDVHVLLLSSHVVVWR